MVVFKALSKKLFGAKYEQIIKSLTACLILFFTIYAAEIKISITPSILFLASTVLSAGIMWQSLNFGQIADEMSGLFMLPFKDRDMIFSIVLTFSGHTLITKTFPVLALLLAADERNAPQCYADGIRCSEPKHSICILVSCDPYLDQALKVLPWQASRFYVRYCLFIFSINMVINSIYLISWQIQRGSLNNTLISTTVLFALLNAILSVFLEWKYPIRNWKTKSDLWHHPRKYLVLLIMMLFAAIISALIR